MEPSSWESKEQKGFKMASQSTLITFDETKLLGKGSGGTCVFEGRLHGRQVAVKRMLR